MKILPRHPLRMLSALLLTVCFAPGIAGAIETQRASAGGDATGTSHAAAQQQLQRLSWEAALVDSSAFGQLRLLRDVQPKAIRQSKTGSTEHCR